MKSKVVPILRYFFFVIYVAALAGIIYGARSFSHFHQDEDQLRIKRIHRLMTQKALDYYAPA